MNVKWLWSRFIWHWGKRRNKSSKNSATFSSVSTWFETKRNISVWYNGWEIHSQLKSIKKEPWWEHLHSFPIEKHKRNLDCSEKSKVEDGKKGERNQHLRYQDQEENVGENEAWGYIHIYIIYIIFIYTYFIYETEEVDEGEDEENGDEMTKKILQNEEKSHENADDHGDKVCNENVVASVGEVGPQVRGAELRNQNLIKIVIINYHYHYHYHYHGIWQSCKNVPTVPTSRC